MRHTNRMIAWVMSVMMAVSAIPQGIGNMFTDTETSQEEATSGTAEVSAEEDTASVLSVFAGLEVVESVEENTDEDKVNDDTEEETTEKPTPEEQESVGALVFKVCYGDRTRRAVALLIDLVGAKA